MKTNDESRLGVLTPLKKGRKTPSLEAVRKAFVYDPVSKTLLRKTSGNGSKLKRPKAAGTVVSSARGLFCQIGVDGRQYPAEVVAYMLHNGKAPVSVRCLNGDRLDLSPQNLIEVEPRVRLRTKGVSKVKKSKDWSVFIPHPMTRKKLLLKTYEDRIEAEALSWYIREYVKELIVGKATGWPNEHIEEAIRSAADAISSDPCGAVDRIQIKLGLPPVYSREGLL